MKIDSNHWQPFGRLRTATTEARMMLREIA
jgi:hypothetical protein